MKYSSKAEGRNYYSGAKTWIKAVFHKRADDDNSDPRSISQHDETGSVLSLDPPFAKLEPILSESLILNQASSESISTERFPSQSVLSDSTILEPTPVESSLLRYALSRSLLDASSLRRPSHGQLLSDDGEYTRRNSLAAMTNSRPTSPFSLGLQHTSEYHGQGSGMHQNRFRRSSAPSRMRRNASRGSYRSQMSVRSMGSQVSFEEMDKYDAILQGIDDLVNDHIKRLRHTFWRQTPKPTRVLNDRCRESLVSFQQCITEYAVEDHEPISEAEDTLRYKSFVHLFNDLKGELVDFSEHNNLSSEEMYSTYCDEFCDKIEAFKNRLPHNGAF